MMMIVLTLNYWMQILYGKLFRKLFNDDASKQIENEQ